MRVGSLFAGVGGFDLGFQRAGMETAWAVEIDKQARSVFRHRFPDAEVYEDVRKVGGQSLLSGGQTSDPGRASSQAPCIGGEQRGRSSADPLPEPNGETSGTDRRTLEPIQLLCGGFPCQDYSVAGKRGGLAGDRGALWWEFHRLIAELGPTWVVGENVPGLLSSNGGRDFLSIIASLVQLGYGVTWAVLDSQYFGVAQRRRRLFIVGHSGGGPRPEILALPEGLFGHPAPQRTAGKEAPTLFASGAGTERTASAGSEAEFCIEQETGWDSQRMRIHDPGGVAPTMSQSDGQGGQRTPIIAFDPNQVTSKTNRSNPTPELCHTIPVGAHAPAIANTVPNKYRGDPHEGTDTIVGTIPRRLTPTECERLQGFPDGWTDVDGMKDGPRYRMIGNAVTVPVIEWIGNRIMEAENL